MKITVNDSQTEAMAELGQSDIANYSTNRIAQMLEPALAQLIHFTGKNANGNPDVESHHVLTLTISAEVSEYCKKDLG